MADTKIMEGKRVVITGASSGPGRATAVAMTARGAIVTVSSRSQDKLDALVKELPPGSAYAVAADLRSTEDCVRLVKEAIRLMGGIDVVVNNGGVGTTPEDDDFPYRSNPMHPEFVREMMDMHVISAATIINEALPELLKNKGNVVNVSSVSAQIPICGFSAYCCAKSAQDTMTRCLALQHGPAGVRFNTVAPGVIDNTGSIQKLYKVIGNCVLPGGGSSEQEVLDAGRSVLASNHPLDTRVAQPEEVAEAIVFLASPQASFITGQRLNVDGGSTLTHWAAQKPAPSQ